MVVHRTIYYNVCLCNTELLSNKYKSIILKQKRGLLLRPLQRALTAKEKKGLIASIIDQFVTHSLTEKVLDLSLL